MEQMSDSSGFQTNLGKFYSIFVELLVKLTKICHFHNLLISYWDGLKIFSNFEWTCTELSKRQSTPTNVQPRQKLLEMNGTV